MLIAACAAIHKIMLSEIGIYARLSKVAWERLWMLERVLELPGAEVKEPFSADECRVDRLAFVPHQYT